jgi:hypothetical protein
MVDRDICVLSMIYFVYIYKTSLDFPKLMATSFICNTLGEISSKSWRGTMKNKELILEDV